MKSVFTLICFFTLSISIQAQNTSQTQIKASINEGSIADQFEFVIQKSSNWRNERGQPYKVIKRNMMTTLKAHTLDSLKAIQDKYDASNKVISTQQNEIADLKSNLNTTQSTLDATNTEKDSMSLLGLQMSKASYNILMWSIIGGLLVFFLIFVYKFKNSNIVTKSAKKALAETEEEFEEHRRNALEREQKVRRQLQDEINKQKGI